MTPKRKALGGKSRAKEICPVRLLGHVTGILINSKSRERHHPPTLRTKNLFQVAKNPWCGLLNMLPFPKANLAQPEAASDACDPKLLSVREDFALWPQGNPKMRDGDLLGFQAPYVDLLQALLARTVARRPCCVATPDLCHSFDPFAAVSTTTQATAQALLPELRGGCAVCSSSSP